MIPFRYKLHQWPKRKHLVISDDVHLCIKMFAEEHGMTITEATYWLLRKALAQEVGLTESGQENPPL